MTDNLVAEFEEFLRQRDAAKKRKKVDPNEEMIDVWDEKGRGARVPACRAKDFLDGLGLDTTGLETPKKSSVKNSDNDDDETDESDDDGSEPRRRPGPAHRHGRKDADDVFVIGGDDE